VTVASSGPPSAASPPAPGGCVSVFAHWFVSWLLQPDPALRPTAAQALSVLGTYLWACDCDGIARLPHYYDRQQSAAATAAWLTSLSDGEVPVAMALLRGGGGDSLDLSAWSGADPRRLRMRPAGGEGGPSSGGAGGGSFGFGAGQRRQ